MQDRRQPRCSAKPTPWPPPWCTARECLGTCWEKRPAADQADRQAAQTG